MARWRCGRPCGCTYGIGIYGKPVSYWRRATSSTHGSLLYKIIVPWWSLNIPHNHTAQCKKGLERKQHRLADEEERASTSRAFSAYGRTLDMVPSFKYLVRELLAADNEWPLVIQYQVMRQLTGRLPWRKLGGRLEYTLAEASREEAGF